MGSKAGEGHSGVFPSAPSAPGWAGVQAGWAASARPASLCPAALDQTPASGFQLQKQLLKRAQALPNSP